MREKYVRVSVIQILLEMSVCVHAKFASKSFQVNVQSENLELTDHYRVVLYLHNLSPEDAGSVTSKPFPVVGPGALIL